MRSMAALTFVVLALSIVITTARPVFDIHPNDQGPITVAEGSDVNMRCKAAGDGNLNYQWMRVSGLFPNNTAITPNGRRLTIYNITVSDSGQYYCNVSDKKGSTSSMKVKVTVKRKPTITDTINAVGEELSIINGSEDVTLICIVAGDDLAGGYWERLNPLQNLSSTSLFLSNGTVQLRITNARPMHSGKYRCVVYSQWGVAHSNTVTVNIKIAPPTITEQPSDVMVEALEHAIFACKAEGFEVKYEWKRYRIENIIGNQSTLNISRATPLDSDQYYCVAMTEGGYAFSNNVTLTVDDGLNVEMQSKYITVGKGSIVVLSVKATGVGNDMFTYQWERVGSDSLPKTATGGNSTQLTITSIRPSGSGLYFCTVMNRWGNMVQSDNATVNVLYITADPIKNTTVAVGTNVALTCNASGADNLKYQWMRMGKKTIPSRARGVNSSTLIIPNIMIKDNGEYKCVVSSGDTSVTSKAGVVFVLNLPTVIIHPSDGKPITVAEGNNMTLRCKANGDGILNYQWKRVSGSLPKNAVMTNINGGKKLTIHNIAIIDSGWYYCEVDNGGDSVPSSRVEVTVKRRPSIVTNPNDQQLSIISNNEQVTLTCEVTGDDIAGGYWERLGGDPLPNKANVSSLSNDKTRLQLIIVGVHPEYSGMYHCVAYSQWGVAQSRNVQVTITIAPPMITTQPTDKRITALQDVTFTCEAKGFNVKYEWKRHNGRVTRGRQPTLTISRATPLDSDQYYCVAMTEGGYAFSNNVTLIVNDIININRQPIDTIVSEGEDVVLRINVRGPGRAMFTYQWKKVGSDSLPNTASGENSTQLTITLVTPSDSGLYYCIVMNQWGNVEESDNATVNVLYITTNPEDRVVAVGTKVTLTCAASGADNLQYQWMRMGEKTVPLRARGVGNNTLIIPSIMVNDSGLYKCVVSSGNVNVTSKVGNVSVLNLPMVSINPSRPITVVEGENVTLKCRADGGGELNYGWRRESGSLPNNAIRNAGGKRLTIPNVVVNDSGQYYCEVDNGGSAVSSKRVSVIVRRRPRITNSSTNLTLKITGGKNKLTLTCTVIGDDIAGGYWERVGSVQLRNNNISSLSDNKTTITMNITEARPEHSGMYYCVAYSQWGVAQSRNVQVTITIAPPVFTRHPNRMGKNTVVTALQNVTFTCKAKGFDVKYEWKRHNGTVTKRRQSTLTISEATPSDSDQYYCVAMTEGGYAFSDNVTLTVNDTIIINEDYPKAVTLSNRDKLALNVIAKGPGSSNFTYKWRKAGNGSLPSTVEGENTQNFTISSVKPSDSGSYYCTVINQWGNMVKSKIITVNVLYIITDPDDMITTIGMNIILTCNATGADNLTYKWMRMGSKGIDSLQATGVNTSTLTISNVTIDESGKYRCIVSGDGATVISECGALSVLDISIADTTPTLLRLNWNVPTSCHQRKFYYTVHIMEPKQSERILNFTDFNGTYALDGLKSYTDYSVYVTVGFVENPQEQISMTVTGKTLAGEPVSMIPNLDNQHERILNDIISMGMTHKVYLPAISNTNGPFSHLYIVVIDSNIISGSTKRTTTSVEDITTAQLIEESKKTSPLYYVAAVVDSTQYEPGYTMSYILGAGDNTTDAYDNRFHNRELRRGVSYFFRVFSIDSSPENEISTTTDPQSIPISESISGEDSSSSSSVVGPIVGVLVALLILIIVIVVVILLLLYYKKRYLKSSSQGNGEPISATDTPLKEKVPEPEKKTQEPLAAPIDQTDEPVIQETSFLESTVVKTSVGQPTTLVIGLPDADMPEVTWKKDAEPVNHPVLPDGSLYIINTDHSDEGEYTVIINRKESTAFENLQLSVINPQLPTVEKPGHSVIKIEDFTEHVALLKAEKDAKLNEEFELVAVNVPFTQHAAKLLCNKAKNRYKNIIPYDHSRVVLDQQDKLKGSDYINASHIDGYGETRAYIAAQGPMNSTIDDFWRMVWEQNVVTVVMLTRLVEDAKAKCQLYWPTKGFKVFGNIKVTLHKEEELANYSTRVFFVEQVHGVKGEIRLIHQFHFTAWPDHGVPKYATPLLEFHKKVDKQHKRKNNKPMLVHCSAGVGRTGTFIAIDTQIQNMNKQNVIDVYDTVRKMRFWRNYMVQTLSQYNFIHMALLEHIACGDTSIAAPINNVEEKIGELSKCDPETNKTGFQLQFEKLARNSAKQTDFMYVAAVSPKNKTKNRSQKLLPPDTARVIIPQLDGNSDYINFCFIDDYRQTKAFLAGPGPMQSTASDFWTMIWEKKSHAIVMLGQLKENGEETCFKYWPNENRTAEFGKFLVETTSEDAWDKDIVKRTFKLTNTKTDDARTVTQLQYVEWSQSDCPDSSALVIDMIEVLERIQRKTGNGPITVHCSDGVGRSGAFCALMVSVNRFKAEQMVDVFRTIITMRTQRPGLVANAEQFEFIHQGLITMIKRFSPYSNFTDGTAV